MHKKQLLEKTMVPNLTPDQERRLIEDLFKARTDGNRETILDCLRRMFMHRGTDPNYPYDAEFYEDFCEVMTEIWMPQDDSTPKTLMIGNKEYEAESVGEINILAWMRQLTKRGLDFEHAFAKAKDRVVEGREPLVYELKPEDDDMINLWIERLTYQGIPKAKATDMAKDVVRIIRQTDFTSIDEADIEFRNENDLKKRRVILEKLAAVKAEGQTDR